MDREEFLKKGITLLGGKILDLVEDATGCIEPIEKLGIKKKRPPGALEEKAFLEACTGCDACMAACPYNIIIIDDLERRDPFIEEEDPPCARCEDQPCITACAFEALILEASSKGSKEHPESRCYS